MIRTMRVLLPLLLFLSAWEVGGVRDASATLAVDTVVPLYTNLGEHTYPISTTNPQAQRYFDQGIRLTYAFNHAEAIRAYTEAARLDPSCAMCQWGIALAHGPNINAPMSEEGGREAVAAVRRAQALANGATPVERALIEALSRRYSDRTRCAARSARLRVCDGHG
jgi:hypothetical protein